MTCGHENHAPAIDVVFSVDMFASALEPIQVRNLLADYTLWMGVGQFSSNGKLQAPGYKL